MLEYFLLGLWAGGAVVSAGMDTAACLSNTWEPRAGWPDVPVIALRAVFWPLCAVYTVLAP